MRMGGPVVAQLILKFIIIFQQKGGRGDKILARKTGEIDIKDMSGLKQI